VAEHGGELIEDGQEHVLSLARELGLELDTFTPPERSSGQFRFGGQLVTPADVKGLPSVLGQLRSDIRDLPGISYRTADDTARRLDEMSAADWIAEHVEGGPASLLGQGLVATLTLNLGLEPRRLSALAIHHMYVGFEDGGSTSEAFAFGHPSDQTVFEFEDGARAAMTDGYRVRGGNDLLAFLIAEALPKGSLRPQSPLIALRRTPDGFGLDVDGGGQELFAHRVVLANPLPTLRNVDLTDSGLSDRRLAAIASVPMGTGFKILVQLERRPEQFPDWRGFAVTDNPMVAIWDTSAGQPGDAGLITLFGQGSFDDSSRTDHGWATDSALDATKSVVRQLAPEMARSVVNRAWFDDWAQDPWAGGSYAAYGPGQYTRFAGFLAEPERGIHFAGEHTSLSSMGYLDGAIASGDRAAREVLGELGLA
jgi:monoamine oxidase